MMSRIMEKLKSATRDEAVAAGVGAAFATLVLGGVWLVASRRRSSITHGHASPPSSNDSATTESALEEAEREIYELTSKTVDDVCHCCRTVTSDARAGNTARLREILMNNVGKNDAVNVRDAHGNSPLHIAAFHGDVSVLNLLLQGGANVLNTEYEHGLTAAHVACAHGKVECLAALLDAGAGLNDTNKDGWSLAYIAAADGQPACLDLLIKRGADINIKSNEGETPLDVAVKFGELHCVNLLRGGLLG